MVAGSRTWQQNGDQGTDLARRLLQKAASVPDRLLELRPPSGIMLLMRLSARADYALRASIELAASREGHVTSDQLAKAQQIPAKFLEAILTPLLGVRGERPENLGYIGAAEPLQTVWIALRANERAILEEVTLAHMVSGQLPQRVQALAELPGSWEARLAR